MRRCIELLLLCLFLSACMATERAINPTQMPDTNTISTGIPVPATIASSATELATSEPIATSLKDQATPEPRSTESVETVQISYGIDDNERAYYQELLEKFNAENPNIIVELKDLGTVHSYSQANAEMTLLERLTTNFDAFSNKTFYVDYQDYASELLVDLKPFMQADPTFMAEDYYPNLLAYSESNGRITLLPQYVKLNVINYDPFVFSKVNIAPPSNDWTISDLLELAEYIGEREYAGSQLYGFNIGDEYILNEIILHFLAEQNIDLVNTDPQLINLTDPEFVKALEQLIAAYNNHSLYLPRRDSNNLELEPTLATLSQSGSLAMWDASVHQYQPEHAETLPFPKDTHYIYSVDHVKGYSISSHAQHPEAVWKWIEFLSRQSFGNNYFLNRPNQVPARDSVRQTMAYWESLDANTADTYRWILEQDTYAKPNFNTPQVQALFALNIAALQTLRSAEPNLAEQLQQAQQRFAEYREQAQNARN